MLALAAPACALAAAALAGLAHAAIRLRVERLAARLAAARAGAILEAVRRCGGAAAQSPGAMRAELARAIRDLVPTVDCVLFFDETDGELACVTADGVRAAYFCGARIARAGSSLPARALGSRHRVTLAEYPGGGFHPAEAFAVALPLPGANGRGSVVYASAATPVDAASCEAIVTLADNAGFAYALACERDDDRQRARFDGLTGLLSPRAFRAALSEALEAARCAPPARLAVLFIDTDRFKDWNDAYGHAAGDALLRAIAGTLRTAAGGRGDVAARNGGDEFCLVLAETEKSAAIERAQCLRAAISGLDFAALRPPGAGPLVCVSASIGVAAFPADATTAQSLLEMADAAMYHSKRNGRNAVSFYRNGVAERAAGPL